MSKTTTDSSEVATPPDPPSAPSLVARAHLGQSWRTAGILIPFLILFVVLSISSSAFLHTTNLINILDQQASTLCIAAAGTLVLVAGGIDLSVGSTYAFAGVTAGMVGQHHSLVLAIGAALAVGLVVGLANGVIVSVFKISPLITTLAMSYVIQGIALKVSSGNLILTGTVPGFTTFVLSGLAASLGGIIDASRLGSVIASSGGAALSFTVLAGIVVGGTSIAGGEGSGWRTAIGVLFIALIGNGFDLLGVDPNWQQIVLGLILLVAVGLDMWARRVRR